MAKQNKFTRLVNVLLEMGTTQESISKTLGVSTGHLSRMMTGDRVASERHIPPLEQAVKKRFAKIQKAVETLGL